MNIIHFNDITRCAQCCKAVVYGKVHECKKDHMSRYNLYYKWLFRCMMMKTLTDRGSSIDSPFEIVVPGLELKKRIQIMRKRFFLIHSGLNKWMTAAS